MKAGPVIVLALLLVVTVLPAAASAQSSAGKVPASLEVAVVPQTLPADGNAYPALVISLVDSAGAPTLSLSDVLVYLSSSNESAASVPATVTLPAGRAYVQVDVQTSSSPGSTILTAASSGLQSRSVSLSTVVPTAGARSLSLTVTPAQSLLALQGSDLVYAVQLQGTGGHPAVANGSTDVVITSSNKSLISKTIDVAMPAGTDVAYGQIMVNESGAATLTALAPQFITANAQLSVAPATPSFTLTVTSSEMYVGNSTAVLLTLQLLGMPITGADVYLSTDGGSLANTQFVMGPAGEVSTLFTSGTTGAFIVSARAIDASLGLNLTASAVVVVNVVPVQSSQPWFVSLIWRYLPIIAVVVVAALIALIIRRAASKRKGAVEDDAYPEPEPAAVK